MEALFTPTKVGLMNLKHRVILAPLTRLRAHKNHVPSDLQVEYYSQRASDGGLLVTEATNISNSSGSFPHTPGIFTKEQIEAWKKVTDVVHSKGSYIYLQLWHSGRTGFSMLNPNNESPVGPSAIAARGSNPKGMPYETPRALEVSEIKQIIQDYTQAALNAIEAGFDGVEIHGANGYLVDQFINSNSNQRTDEYGGSSEKRSRFALEVVESVSKAVGEERTAIRFSPGGAFQDMKDDTPIETWGYLISQIKEKHPNLAYMSFMEPRADQGDDLVEEGVDSLKPFRDIWKKPFITAGGFSNGTKFALQHAENTGDLIAFGRAFIANPDLPERIRNDYPLNPYHRPTFYTNDPEGYTDYPFYKN
ncbi:FMN-linked oxidoreductase [Backusella circina FSU 941]|nr:FMN-linked oxidoreductase [Backusella circina FSU 941]